jgi:hypothetical protein
MKYLIRVWGVVTLLISFLLFFSVIATLLKFAADKEHCSQDGYYNMGYIAGYMSGEIAVLIVAYLLFRYGFKKAKGA